MMSQMQPSYQQQAATAHHQQPGIMAAQPFVSQHQPNAAPMMLPNTRRMLPSHQKPPSPMMQPTQPAMMQPTQPAMMQPTQPSMMQPTQPSMMQPTQPSMMRPTQPPTMQFMHPSQSPMPGGASGEPKTPTSTEPASRRVLTGWNDPPPLDPNRQKRKSERSKVHALS